MLSIIKTDKSYLNLHSYADNYIIREIIDKCIKEVKDCLDIKPSIKFMGKIVYQQRDVGFFLMKQKDIIILENLLLQNL
jgi:hypothetical protein